MVGTRPSFMFMLSSRRLALTGALVAFAAGVAQTPPVHSFDGEPGTVPPGFTFVATRQPDPGSWRIGDREGDRFLVHAADATSTLAPGTANLQLPTSPKRRCRVRTACGQSSAGLLASPAGRAQAAGWARHCRLELKSRLDLARRTARLKAPRYFGAFTLATEMSLRCLSFAPDLWVLARTAKRRLGHLLHRRRRHLPNWERLRLAAV